MNGENRKNNGRKRKKRVKDTLEKRQSTFLFYNYDL